MSFVPCVRKAGRQALPVPDKALASLEAYCISVSDLAASCGMKYINGQNTVTYFGAVMFNESK